MRSESGISHSAAHSFGVATHLSILGVTPFFFIAASHMRWIRPS